MDSKEIIKNYSEFIDLYYKRDINKFIRGSISHVTIDLNKLAEFNFSMVDCFIDEPEDNIRLINECLNAKSEEKILFKVIGLPDTEFTTLNELRAEQLGKIVKVKGMIRRKTDVLPKVKHLVYLCINPDCPCSIDKLLIPQLSERLKKLKCCPRCKSNVELMGEDNIDFQVLVLEETPEDLVNSNLQPKNKQIFLEDLLTSSLTDNKQIVGSKVEVIGIVKKKPQDSNKGEKVLSDMVIEALNVISLDEDTIDLKINKQDIRDIKELSKEPELLTKLKNSIAPSISGRDKIKEATLYFIVGGNKEEDQREHVHILTIGNASLGKSQILRRLNKFLPKSVYASGENTSKAGLTGAAIRDELTGDWTIEAGAMAYANNGFFLLDEADKMDKENQTNMNEALEHQTVSINKIVKGKLKTDCPAYVVANPKGGRFDENTDYIKQINFDPTFLSRFDLVFILDSNDGLKEQENVIDKLLGLSDDSDKFIDDVLLMKYLIYAKSLTPTISQELKLKIKNYFISISNMAKEKNSIDITYRQLRGLIRMCEARAKLHLRKEVNLDDVQSIILLMNHCLNKFGISEITTGISNNFRSKGGKITDCIGYLNSQKLHASVDNIINLLDTRHGFKILKIDLERYLDKLKQESEIFEPTKNEFRVL